MALDCPGVDSDGPGCHEHGRNPLFGGIGDALSIIGSYIIVTEEMQTIDRLPARETDSTGHVWLRCQVRSSTL